jgi:hypothetical protein
MHTNIELTYEVMGILEGAYSPINKANGIVYCAQQLSSHSNDETITGIELDYFASQLTELSDVLTLFVEGRTKTIAYLLPYSMHKKLTNLYESMNDYLENAGPDQLDNKLIQAQVMSLYGASDFVREAESILSRFADSLYPPAKAA